MEELEEGVNVNIQVDETPEPEQEVKELAYEFNTMMSNDASGYSELINGKLVALIVSSNKPVWLQISSADNGFMIYEKKDYQGTYYLPVKITPVSKSGQQFNLAQESFYLNEQLYISIRGQAESIVSIKIRWVDD